MKTSNKIIIAFVLFILSGMIILFADSKKHHQQMKDIYSYKEFPLPAFSVVVAHKGSDLHLDQLDTRSIKVQYDKSKPTPSKLYEVVNDTLHVYSGLRLFVTCENITALIGNKPFWVGVNNFTPDSLTIQMNGGALFVNCFGYAERKGEHKQVNLSLQATDSAYVELRKIDLRNFTVESNNAEVNAYCKAKNAAVKLENHAQVFSYDNFDKLAVEKDTTSRFKSNYVRVLYQNARN